MAVGLLFVVVTATGSPFWSVMVYPPFRFGLFGDDLSGDIGDDWSPPGDLPGFLVHPGQGGEVDPDIDHTSIGAGSVGSTTVEQVQEDVGSDLVDAPWIAFRFEAPGEPVDPSHRRIGIRWG